MSEIALDDGVSGRTPAEQALRRVLSGERGAHDEQLIGFEVTGARVVVIELDADDSLNGSTLPDASRGVVAVRLCEKQLVALVRHTPRRADEDRGLVAARRYASDACRLGRHVRVGISSALRRLDDIPVAYADARDAARLAPAAATVEVDSLWAEVVLARLRDRLPELLTLGNPVATLTAYDDSTGSDLWRSVGTWLRTNRDTALAAEELCVHPNTLRYRLRRAADTTGLDLGDGAQRLAVELIERCVRP